MGLRQKRRFNAFELPELVAVILILAATVPLTLWARGLSATQYRTTTGSAVKCEIHRTHYNATDSAAKITLTYRYAVGTQQFTHTWTGLWPETGSPNALPPDGLDVLREKAHPLVVFYDPDNPVNSQLHVGDHGFQRIYGGVALAMCGLAVAYCAVVYPKWRSMR